ncbi:hypothetical protein [Nostoc sp. ChiSLP03a]|uniref:hypothetical protein n=1 Tax=Nostoc sp. ChiSLP03a TaxID=3075380 RepID=UPI002AD4CBBB|nr:hypothetical protein [Nostoc sp. ChiSLP03a]MDZ8216286.1 hypothetical protein [Nostoc sp. ChiSLP03a]
MIRSYWKIWSSVALLILSISACSNGKIQDTKSNTNSPDDEFEYQLNFFLQDADSSVRVAYQQLFGKDKSIQEAKEYCIKLDQGKNSLSLMTDKYDELTQKVKENKITKRERDAISNVYSTIHRTAQDIYCPQHRDKDQIPLNERLN